MAEMVSVCVLCVVLMNSIPVSTAPKLPMSPWSSLTTIPKLPTVPSLDELNIAIQGLTSQAKSTPDLEILETKIDENINECFDCDVEIIELEAEELDAEDEKIEEDENHNEMMLENDLDKNTEQTTEANDESIQELIENIDDQHIEILSEVKDNGYENNTETKSTDANIQTLVITSREDANKTIYETTKTTKSIKKTFDTTTDKPLPKFVPIFRPKKQSRLSKIDILTRKTPLSLPNDEKFTALRNSIENNDLIVQYIKNPESKPVLNIFGPRNVLKNSNIRVIPLNSMQSDGITVNSYPSNTINTNLETSNGQHNMPLNVVPYNTESLDIRLANNAPNNFVPIPNNIVPLNTTPESGIPLNPAHSSPANALPASIAIIPPNTISTNPTSMNIPTNIPFPLNTVPKHALVLSTNPTTSFPANTLPANSEPFNIAPNKCDCPANSNSGLLNAPRILPTRPVHECPIPTNINEPAYPISPTTCTTATFPANTVPQNVFPNRLPPANLVPTNIATTDPRYTAPSNMLSTSGAPLYSTTNILPTGLNRSPSYTTPQRLEPSCPYPSNAPLKSISPNMNPRGGNPGCNECQKCSDCPKKADLVLFRPENVTVTTVCGDYLKKTTMTVLRPIHVSKLDV